MTGNIAVAAVWIVFLTGAISSGVKMGHAIAAPVNRAPFPPVNTAVFLVVFFFVVTSAGVFVFRRALFQNRSWTARLIDKVWGQGAWTNILVRLKPTALMMVVCCTTGFLGLASTYVGSQSWTAYVNSAVALSMGLGLAISYSLSRKFPPALP